MARGSGILPSSGTGVFVKLYHLLRETTAQPSGLGSTQSCSVIGFTPIGFKP